MRSCLTAFLFTLLLIGAVVGVGALAMGQVHAGLCSGQPLRLVLGLLGGGIGLALVLLLLLSLVNSELLEKSMSGMQVLVISISLALAGLGVSGFFTYRSAQASCPRANTRDQLASVCQGKGLSESNAARAGTLLAAATLPAATSQPPDASALRLVVLGEDGQAIDWTAQARKQWAPKELSEVELVVCAGPIQRSLIETCRYGGGIKVNRYLEEAPVRLVDAQEGRTLVAATLTGVPPPCQPMGLQNLLRLRGRVAYSDVIDWVAKIMAGEPAAGVTPTPTPIRPTTTPRPTATWTPAPTATPQMIGKVAAGARVRAGPSTEDKTLAGVVRGDKVVILGANQDWSWLKVETPNGVVGWIFATLVQPPVPYTDIPQVP